MLDNTVFTVTVRTNASDADTPNQPIDGLKDEFTFYWKVPVMSLAIDAPNAITVARGGTYHIGVKVNEFANIDDLVWTVNNAAYATVNPDGSITIRNLTGSVMLTVTDPASGLKHSVMLRIM